MLEKNYLWRIYWRLAGVIMLCVVVALAVVSYFSHRVFDRELVPETEQKAATVGASVRALVLKATGYGIDFAQLYGVEDAYSRVALSLWALAPDLGSRQVLIVGLAWVHAMIGLHSIVKLRVWYPRAAPWLLGIVVVVPVLAILGILLILAWKNAGYIGLDYFLLPMLGTPWKQQALAPKATPAQRTPAVAAL